MSKENDRINPNNAGLPVARSVAALRNQVAKWRAEGLSIAFTPTMGALHQGHLSLIAHARTLADRNVASIFVNPKQFAAHEDLGTYPRDERADFAALEKAQCDLVFVPDVKEMYPDGYQTAVQVGDLSQGLCGASRPHFFGGVATVVCKLLNQVRPDFAVFGEKDFQQLLIIRRMVRDLDMPVEIAGAPIIREADGLAMSSRNAYLSGDARQIAGRLNKIISAAADKIQDDARIDTSLEDARTALREGGFTEIDYLEVRNVDDLGLMGPGPITTPARLFVAVVLDRTRLIDNWPIDI